jgi:hypothetical protein
MNYKGETLSASVRPASAADRLSEKINDLQAAVGFLENTVAKLTMLPPSAPTNPSAFSSTPQTQVPLFNRLEDETERVMHLTEELRQLTNLVADRL